MANPSYLRIRRPLEDAMQRYAAWIGLAELEPPRLVGDAQAIDDALAEGEWKGLAVYVYHANGWTIFEELSGGLAERVEEGWAPLAAGGDLVFAGYNDAIGYGELVVVEEGRLVRRFLQDEQEPTADRDMGRLPGEADKPIIDWMDVEGWVAEDQDEVVVGAKEGWLWIHRLPASPPPR